MTPMYPLTSNCEESREKMRISIVTSDALALGSGIEPFFRDRRIGTQQWQSTHAAVEVGQKNFQLQMHFYLLISCVAIDYVSPHTMLNGPLTLRELTAKLRFLIFTSNDANKQRQKREILFESLRNIIYDRLILFNRVFVLSVYALDLLFLTVKRCFAIGLPLPNHSLLCTCNQAL